MPLGSRLNKGAEDGPRTFIAVIGAFRMPLHRQHKLIGRRPLDRLLHPVLGAPRHQPQSIAQRFGRLMMAGIYRHGKFVAGGQSARAAQDSGQPRLWIKLHPMCLSDPAPSLVVDSRRQCLVERARPPHIQRLQPVTDAEDRLAHVVGILQQQLIGVIAKGVDGRSLRMALCAIFLGIDIRRTARQEHAVAALDGLRDLRVGSIRRNDDWLSSSRANRPLILRQRAKHIEWPRRVGGRNGNTRLHVGSFRWSSEFGVSSGLGFASPLVFGKDAVFEREQYISAIACRTCIVSLSMSRTRSPVVGMGSPMINSTTPGNTWRLFMGSTSFVPTIAIGTIGVCALMAT